MQTKFKFLLFSESLYKTQWAKMGNIISFHLFTFVYRIGFVHLCQKYYNVMLPKTRSFAHLYHQVTGNYDSAAIYKNKIEVDRMTNKITFF